MRHLAYIPHATSLTYICDLEDEGHAECGEHLSLEVRHWYERVHIAQLALLARDLFHAVEFRAGRVQTLQPHVLALRREDLRVDDLQ